MGGSLLAGDGCFGTTHPCCSGGDGFSYGQNQKEWGGLSHKKAQKPTKIMHKRNRKDVIEKMAFQPRHYHPNGDLQISPFCAFLRLFAASMHSSALPQKK
jgi:hypothetical protein